jgi:8-amino-7-oxononanoate synthase
MPAWREQLLKQQDQRKGENLWRELAPTDQCAAVVKRAGRSFINFAGNDYLGLATDAHLREAVIAAAQQLGVGSGASQLITGHLQAHEQLAHRFAQFKHAQAALLCPTGYMANLAAITTLAAPGDVIYLDKLNHASLIDAARASGATVRVFPHRGYDKLARLLERAPASGGVATSVATNAASTKRARRQLIVTDAVFSMDGDCADLTRLIELRDRHDAILIVDEAHGTGVLGDTGSGLCEHQHIAGRVDVTISTASKALGSLGGLITADRLIIDELINAARSFIYTTAMPPTQVAAIAAALDVIRDQPDRRDRLQANARHLRNALRERGWPIADDPTPIVPVVVGQAGAALALASRLDESGFLAPAIRPPTVAPGSARIRLTCRADHTPDQIDRLADAIGDRQDCTAEGAGNAEQKAE